MQNAATAGVAGSGTFREVLDAFDDDDDEEEEEDVSAAAEEDESDADIQHDDDDDEDEDDDDGVDSRRVTARQKPKRPNYVKYVSMGLTETAAQILSNPLPPGTRKIGSPGVAFGNRVAILDARHQPCGPDTEGEIAVSGPNVMLEYLKNPDATRETFAGEWLRTGDLGRMDRDGYFYVTGRLKEMIIKGGENIAPREIDEALYSHSDVIEAAAFGRPCESYGETVEAAVKVREGSDLSAEELRRICEVRLGRFKSPDLVHFLEELPKGPSGKIQRRKLLDILPRS